MNVTGVVVNYRTPELTVEAARSLLVDGVKEVIVVDNASADGSPALIREELPEVRIEQTERNLGFGQAANRAVALAGGDLVFFLNSDARVEQGCVRLLVDVLDAQPEVGVVAPQVVEASGSTQVDAAGEFPGLASMLTRRNRRARRSGNPEWVSGVAMLVRASEFRQIGGFDPKFHMYLEDVDLCSRYRTAGKVVVVEHRARVIHLGGGSYRATVERERAYEEALVTYLRCRDHGELYIVFVRVGHRLMRSVRRARRALQR